MDIVKANREAWDKLAETGDVWTQGVSEEVIERAKAGDWHIVLTPKKPIPKSWFPDNLTDKKVLCLASGGGQQGPVLAAVGAEVTVFDNSQKQLDQDLLVAKREGLEIKTIQGDMRDLSAFLDESFDLIIHPWSNCFVDDILPVWKEAYRVLKKGGSLLSGFANPTEYIFDYEKLEEGIFQLRHTLPYSDLTSTSQEELESLIASGQALVFGHTLEDQIQGQISAGFLIAGFYEDISGTALDQYMMGGIATWAIKL